MDGIDSYACVCPIGWTGDRCQTSEWYFADKFYTNVQNMKIVEFHYYIWNPNENCIELSTNMIGIGSLIREIGVKM